MPFLAAPAAAARRPKANAGTEVSLAELLARAGDDLEFACQGTLSGYEANESIEALQRCIKTLQKYADETNEQRKRSLRADSQYAVDVSATTAMLRRLQSQEEVHRRLFDGFRQDEQQDAQNNLKSLGGGVGKALGTTRKDAHAAQIVGSAVAAETPAGAKAASVVSAVRGLQLLRTQRLQQKLQQQLQQLQKLQPQQQPQAQPQMPVSYQKSVTPLRRLPREALSRPVSEAEALQQGEEAQSGVTDAPEEGALSDEQVPVEVGSGEGSAEGARSGAGFAVVEEAR